MRIILIVMADIFIAFVAAVAAYEYFNMKRYNTFTVPFVKKLIDKEIMPEDKGNAILNEDKYAHYIGIGLSLAVAIMLSMFIAGVSGYIVFIVVEAALLLFIKPEMEETCATRSSFFRAHRNDMDALKYRQYLIEVGDIKDE